MTSTSSELPGVQILGARDKQTEEILTPEALKFVVELERRFVIGRHQAKVRSVGFRVVEVTGGVIGPS